MPRKRSRVPLGVWLNGRLVGQLRRAPSGAIDFRYAGEWLDWQHAFPVSLSLPLREDPYVGDPVVAVFDNLLPDSGDVRTAVAARTGAEGTDVYSLLAAIGRDCVGALQFLPEGQEPPRAGAVEAEPISDEEIADRLRNLSVAPLGLGDDEAFRISIPGVQEKTALFYWRNRWHVPLGASPTTHILKPQIGLHQGRELTRSVENEHLCLRLLEAMGLPVAHTEIVDFAGVRALVVERFDRLWTRDGRLLRRPQEDLCQALSVPASRKYENRGGPGITDILELLKSSDEPEEDRRLFMQAQIAFWLLAATDGHAKNFSVFLFPSGGFRLTPLYDVMSTQPLADRGQLNHGQMKLSMAVGDDRQYRLDRITPKHFIETATAAGMPVGAVEGVFDELAEKLPAAVEEVGNSLPADFPPDLFDSITTAALRRRAFRPDPNVGGPSGPTVDRG
ncbi:type II toxin-antitoxin system HipA family toxin [Lentisalinibacter orientalis]|uniref:type II toxin-antitoxin system HipA family toxin n=1 Tax=Lentisalinibacter orientalis TaxID=2992241 RepID=UPI0038670A1C